MKKIFLFAAIAVFQFATAQKTIELGNLKALTVGSDSKLTMIKSNENKLVIKYEEGDSNYFKENGGSLLLAEEGDFTLYYKGSLESIVVNADAVLLCNDEIKSKRLRITASEDAVVTLTVDVKHLQTIVNEDAVVTLKGKVKNHDAILDADAELNAKNLVSQNADILLSEDAVAVITAKKAVNAKAGEDATIQIYGNPPYVSKKSESDATITVM